MIAMYQQCGIKHCHILMSYLVVVYYPFEYNSVPFTCFFHYQLRMYGLL